MNDNNYILLPQVKIGFIYNNIQTVVPFVLDESLDVYNLLKKLVDYCNELGARSNELQYILKDLVEFLNNKLNDQRDYINNFLTNLHQEWLEYKASLEDRYDEFTTKVDELFETYKNQIRDEYNSELANIRTNNDTLYNNLKKLLDDKIKELTDYANNIEPNIDNYIDEKDQVIRELITNFQNEFTEYQKTVNNDLIELGDTLTELINTNEQNVINQINSKTQEILNTLSNVNMQELVNEKLDSYSDEELAELFKNLYGSIITITYMDTNTPPAVTGTTPIYHYNPTTNVLTDCTTGSAIPLNENSIYLFENRVFLVKSLGTNNATSLNKSIYPIANTIDGYIASDINSNLVVYSDEFDKLFELSYENYNLIYRDYTNSLYIMLDYPEKKYLIYHGTQLVATLNTADYIPNEDYTYEGYGIGIIDSNNFIIFNYIQPDMHEVTIPDFEQLMKIISYTYVSINNSEIVKGNQYYLPVFDYLTIYPLLNGNIQLLKLDNNKGIIYNGGFPLYPITLSGEDIQLDGRSFNLYGNPITGIIKIENGFIIQNFNEVGKLIIDPDPSLSNIILPNENVYQKQDFLYKKRFIPYSNIADSFTIDKIPYYDIELGQLIYVNNPKVSTTNITSIINNDYLYIKQSNLIYRVYKITNTSGILAEIPYQRSDS